MDRLFSFRSIVLLVVATVLVGCHSEVRRYPVSGRVTHQGKPIGTGTIGFYPTDGSASIAQLQADGTYSLVAVAGEHQVTVEARQVETNIPSPTTPDEEFFSSNQSGAETLRVIWLAPERYSVRDTSPLTATVSVKNNTIDFDLP